MFETVFGMQGSVSLSRKRSCRFFGNVEVIGDAAIQSKPGKTSDRPD